MCKYLFLLPLLVLLYACSGGSSTTASRFESWMQQNGKVKVLSTTAMIDDLVGQVGRDRIDRLSLITGEIDPHSYELVKGDDEKLSMATLIFSNGLGLEHGASLRAWLGKRKGVVAVGEEVQKRYPELILKSSKTSDPHIWMDVSLWAKAVDPIVEALIQADPEGEAFYQKNGKEVKEKMEKLHQQIVQRMQNIPAEKRFLVTSHDAFNYFTRAYLAEPMESSQIDWQKRFAAPEGLAPDGQLSVSDIQGIIKHLSHHGVNVIFPESNVSKDSLKKIASACAAKGIKITLCQLPLYADSMGCPESEVGTYVKMIEHNATVLEDAWR